MRLKAFAYIVVGVRALIMNEGCWFCGWFWDVRFMVRSRLWGCVRGGREKERIKIVTFGMYIRKEKYSEITE